MRPLGGPPGISASGGHQAFAGGLVRPLSYSFPPFGQRSLSARKRNACGVYFIFKSMEQGPTFRISRPKYPSKDPHYRIVAHQRSRFTHYYFYIRDETLGPMVVRVLCQEDAQASCCTRDEGGPFEVAL